MEKLFAKTFSKGKHCRLTRKFENKMELLEKTYRELDYYEIVAYLQGRGHL